MSPLVPSLALIILDGWGLAEPGPGNAISLAETPVFDRLWDEFPHTQLSAQGRDVGLPDGQMGNSEVGHLNLGAGAVVKQDLARIDDSIADGSFFENPALRAACDAEKASDCTLHVLCLLSPGGVRLAVKRILGDPAYRRRAREIQAWSERHDGASRAADLVEQAAEKAAGRRSPAGA